MGMMLMTVVTWNLQRYSLREQNRSRLGGWLSMWSRGNARYCWLRNFFWEGKVVIWMGEDQHRTALVHGRTAGILLRGTALLRWIEEGQLKWMFESVTAVSVGGVRLVAVCQPIWMTDDEGLEHCRREMEDQLFMCRNERLLVGGDWNEDVGRGCHGILSH